MYLNLIHTYIHVHGVRICSMDTEILVSLVIESHPLCRILYMYRHCLRKQEEVFFRKEVARSHMALTHTPVSLRPSGSGRRGVEGRGCYVGGKMVV